MFTFLIIALAFSGVVYGCRGKSLPYVPLRTFDEQRYMGHWYELARFDHRFERGLEYVTADYELLGDGKFKVTNTGFDAKTGRRRIITGKGKATSVKGHLRVSFFLAFYFDYNILYLSDDYDRVIIGSRTSKYLWIMARTPKLTTEKLNELVNIARDKGYDVDKLIFTVQERTFR